LNAKSPKAKERLKAKLDKQLTSFSYYVCDLHYHYLRIELGTDKVSAIWWEVDTNGYAHKTVA